MWCVISLVVSEDTVWRDQFYDGHPKLEKSLFNIIMQWSYLYAYCMTGPIVKKNTSVHLQKETAKL